MAISLLNLSHAMSRFTTINSYHLGFSVLLGVIGFLINLYPIPLFANVELVLGNTVMVIVAVLLGPWYALLSATIAVTGLMLVWDSPHVYLLFTLEAIFLGLARRRDIYALYASGVYWLLMGAPLLYLYAQTFLDVPPEHMPFAIIKQVINGLICTSLASIIIILTPWLWNFKGKIVDKRRRAFSSQLTYCVTLLITLCLLSSSLIYNYVSLEKQQILISESLEETAEHIATATEKYLNNHLKVVVNAAHLLSISQTKSQDWQTWLKSIHQNYPSFATMIIADLNALVVAASPDVLFTELSKDKQLASIKDREYFTQAFVQQKNYLSPAFIGRGYGRDPIVAISAPFYANGDMSTEKKPIGIIEGSLDLRNFNSLESHNSHRLMQGLVIIDSNNKVVYSSKELALPIMSDFSYSDGTGLYNTRLNLINLHNLYPFVPEYIHAKRTLSNNWQVFILDPFSPLLSVAREQLFNSFLVLLISLVATFFISRKISQLLTEPLKIIAEEFNPLRDNKVQLQLLDDATSREVYSLHQRLIKSKRKLITHQLELEETVALRTQELEAANKRLQVLVDKDPLTGMYNRRYAENKFAELREFCHRSGQAMTIAILDLDHFKKINDTYGHQAGDECLKQVAHCLSEFFTRDTDIVARFGGEEVILILPMSNALHIQQHLNEFRETLAATIIQSPLDEQTFQVCASIGAITANANWNKDLDRWLKVADDNLYQAKEQGRNQSVVSLISDEPRTAKQ
ncbi:sensor domain-containing diguanylate cyclase [Shewanella sp.]|uniref:sensor domain-containing diguanylate cyclase n=1 Tax=Shewanella sp. TaxID=50422 RepID=UPI00405479D3